MKVGDLVTHSQAGDGIGLIVNISEGWFAPVSVLWLTGCYARDIWSGSFTTFKLVIN